MIYLLILIILALILYLAFLYHEIYQLHQQIKEKQASQSQIRILKRHPFLFMNSLVTDYNQLFDQWLKDRQNYQQERQMLDQTIHNISHDIRTPLTVSWGYTKQLLKAQPHNPILQKIDQSLANVSHRLEDLLTYQNLLEHNIHPHLEAVNLAENLTENLMQFYDTYNRLNFQVDIQIEPNVWIQADSEILNRILSNLLGNIAKHGKDQLSVHLSQTDQEAILEINNHAKQDIRHIDKLTQRFYSEDLSSSEKSSGLGLYITDTLVEMTQGRLQVNYQAPLFLTKIIWPLSQTHSGK